MQNASRSGYDSPLWSFDSNYGGKWMTKKNRQLLVALVALFMLSLGLSEAVWAGYVREDCRSHAHRSKRSSGTSSSDQIPPVYTASR